MNVQDPVGSERPEVRTGSAAARATRSVRTASSDCRSPFVDVSALPQGHHYHQENVIGDRVDDPVVTYSHPTARPPSQLSRRRWSGILGQKRDCALDTGPDTWIELTQCPGSGRAHFNAVAAHTQPRSALTCSQGRLSPSSAIAASNAAMSSISSCASTSSS